MRLKAVVPNFNAQTTTGPIQFYEWQENSYVLLFSHPADFTPVCTTELGQIALNRAEFAKRNVKLLAHSVDSVQSHFEWIKDINSYCVELPTEFPYPIIADEKRDLAIELGMLDEEERNNADTAITIRALYIIGPDHRVRLSMFYPHGTGRCINEILRCIDSVQLTDRIKNVVTPANWTPKDPVLILPTVSDDGLRQLFPEGHINCSRLPSGRKYMRAYSNYY